LIYFLRLQNIFKRIGSFYIGAFNRMAINIRCRGCLSVDKPRETVHISSPPEIISVAVVILKFNAVHMAAAVSLDMFFPIGRLYRVYA